MSIHIKKNPCVKNVEMESDIFHNTRSGIALNTFIVIYRSMLFLPLITVVAGR